MRTLFFCAMMLAAGPAAADAVHYRIVDLGSPGDSSSFGRAINNAGIVAGSFNTDVGTTPFYAAPGQASVVFAAATSDYDYTDATGINDAGQIVGSKSSVGAVYGYRYTPGGVAVPLAPLPDDDVTQATAINAAGVVAGTSIQFHGTTATPTAVHGFTATPGGGPVDIGSLNGGWTFAYGINDLGQVTGQSAGADGADHAFVYTPGVGMIDIDPFGSSSHGRAIDDAGQVAGYAFTPDRDYRRAFLYTPGQGTRVLNPAGDMSDYSGWGINASGAVVGSVTSTDSFDGFIFDGRQTLTLSRLVDNLAPGDQVLAAYAINDVGQITGDGLFDGEIHAFRLDPDGIAPVPEPGIWSLLIAGFGATGLATRRRRAQAA